MFRRIFGKRDTADTPAPVAVAEQRMPDVPAPVTPVSTTSVVAGVGKESPLPWDDDDSGHSVPFASTQPMALHALDASRDLTPQQRKEATLGIVELHHHRIANTIRTLWGYKECSVYINKLIMAGGDGMGHARVGFHQDAVQAMLVLSDLHDAEFGPPDSIPAALGL